MSFAEISGFQKPYADSSVFFAAIKKEAIPCSNGLMRWQIAEDILREAEQGQYQLYTSTITLAEVRRIRERNIELTQTELNIVSGFFRNEYLSVAAVTREIAESAQFLGAQYGIWPMDAIHLATAIHLQCDALVVWDKRFSARFQGASVQGVRVMEP